MLFFIKIISSVSQILIFFASCFLIRDIFNWFVIDYFSLEPINIWIVYGISLCFYLMNPNMSISDAISLDSFGEKINELKRKGQHPEYVARIAIMTLMDQYFGWRKIIFTWIFACICYNLFM